MELTLRHTDARVAGKLSVTDRVFGADFNEALVHQAVTMFMAGARSGTKMWKTRSDVRGGGRKPWRQKGSGRARAGTICSPLWRGGGVTFAARSNYAQKLNKKMYRGAMRAIFSELVRQERLILVKDFGLETSKTKEMVSRMKQFDLSNALIVVDEVTDQLRLATRNIPNIKVVDTHMINPYLLIRYDAVLMTRAALTQVEGSLG